MRLLGKKKKIPAKGPCPGLSPRPGQARAGQLPQYLADWMEYAVWYTCNNVGQCWSWEVAARAEWPSDELTD